MGDEMQNNISFTSLPDEVIKLILRNNECRDILHFGETCKQFNEMVNNDQYLWKLNFKAIVPKDVFHMVELYFDDVNWYNKVKNYYTMKKTILSELVTLSPKCYWYTCEINLEDVATIFTLALSENMNYYYTVKILQDFIKKANQYLDGHVGVKPYTMTEMHYAKLTLSHLMHLYLCVEWVQKYTKGQLHAEAVVNFFIRWTEVENMHDDEDIERMITVLADKVENTIIINQSLNATDKDSIRVKCAKREISERQVLAAVTDVIYNQEGMTVLNYATVNSLDLVQVSKSKRGHAVAVATIYQSVARRFGVLCDVITFPNHLFLEWHDTDTLPTRPIYRVNLNTGELQPKRSCTYFVNPVSIDHKYSPDLLLQYIFSAFTNTMEGTDNWQTKNSSSLLAFLQTEYPQYNNPYQNYHLFLRHDTPLHLMPSVSIKYIQDEHKHVVKMLSKLSVRDEVTGHADVETDRNFPGYRESRAREGQSPPVINVVQKPFVIKRRSSNVKYAVGMICANKKMMYECIIHGWEPTCYRHWHESPDIRNLQFGGNQPFYDVYANDYSKRYVAQEDLVEVMRPTRYKDLEDMLGREFTHFNGFAYEPNDEKRSEYPDDDQVRMMFHSRANEKENLDGASYNVH